MGHAFDHAMSSVKRFGGKPEDYVKIHEWFDEPKGWCCDFRSRMVRHHAEGIHEAVKIFGIVITNSNGEKIPVSLIGEYHVMEDCGRIPSFVDWVKGIIPEPWMNTPKRLRKRTIEL